MGWERKRGKLHELNLLLRGDNDTTFLPPDTPLPRRRRPCHDARCRHAHDARRGRRAWSASSRHPLNRPRFDAPSGRVSCAGYGILQPRVTASLTTGDEASFFQRVFSANRGLDPYVFAVSDLYQDVFGDGTFTGKGLYHVDAFEAALKGRIAENDGAEPRPARRRAGALRRWSPMSNWSRTIPTRYRRRRVAPAPLGARRLAAAALHLRPRGSGVPALSRWKMIDNLRRSLTPISWVMASIAGWTLLPFDAGRAVAGAADPQLVHGADLRHRRRAPAEEHAKTTLRGHFNALLPRRRLRHGAGGAAHRADRPFGLADGRRDRAHALPAVRQPPPSAGMAHRLAGAARPATTSLAGYYRIDVWRGDHRRSSGWPARSAAGSTGAGVALIFALFWIGSPAFAWLVSRSAETEDRLDRRATQDKAKLRAIARRTWLYFETFVTAEHNILPPDNFQETPAAGGRRPHLADQYRHLPAVDRLGARLRLDQPRRRRRAARSDDGHPREAWRRIAAISTTGTTRTDAAAAASALRVERRQRQSRRPPDRRGGRLQRMGDGAGRLPRGRFPRPARRRHHPRARASTRCPTTAAS